MAGFLADRTAGSVLAQDPPTPVQGVLVQVVGGPYVA